MKKINGDALRKKAQYMDQLGRIYDALINDMNWECMRRSEEPDETGNYTFTVPEQDESDGYYMSDYDKYMVYQDVLAAIEKLAK